MANSIVHFEIFVDDVDRAITFYENVFGWAFMKLGAEMNNYVLAYPGGEITEGPATSGINGGMMLRPGPAPESNTAAPNAFVCTLATDDIAETIKVAVAQGGRLDMDIMDVPGVGKVAYVRDTEMNMVGLLQPESVM